jgi:hypothetical protein
MRIKLTSTLGPVSAIFCHIHEGELTTANFGHGQRLVREPSWRETGYEWEDKFKLKLQGGYKQCHFEDRLEDHVDD